MERTTTVDLFSTIQTLLDDQPVLSPEQIRLAEEIAMTQYGIPQELLMEHAAMAVASEICGSDEVYHATAAVLAGPGNNGADGLAVARLLVRRGVFVTVFEADPDCRNAVYVNHCIFA